MEARKKQRCAMALGEYDGAFDTTADTTQAATPGNGRQPPAKKSL
jgi:hypothetical protein